MGAFTIKAVINGFSVGFIVLPQDSALTKFRLEMITGAPKPLILERLNHRWKAGDDGCIPLSKKSLRNLGQAIQRFLNQHKPTRQSIPENA